MGNDILNKMVGRIMVSMVCFLTICACVLAESSVKLRIQLTIPPVVVMPAEDEEVAVIGQSALVNPNQQMFFKKVIRNGELIVLKTFVLK